ncbi:MAG TPA: hypothetical protein V6D14_02105 [Coleofasciculaceae cyanobacterium]
MLRSRLNVRIAVALLVMVASLFLFFGYGHTQEQAQKGMLRISPSELFTGELKRLEPHLGLTGSGCVKVDYKGVALPIDLEWELWQNGTFKSLGHSSTSITQPSEVSFSVKEVSRDKETSKYQLITAVSEQSGYTSTTRSVELPKLEGATTQKRLTNTIDIKDTKAIAVWALLANQGSVDTRDDEPFEEATKRVETALVFKFSPGNKVERNKNPTVY